MISGRRVLLAVTGGVAAYKSALLTRLLVEAGADVRVILTESAHHFVGPQTFSALTGSHPYTSLFDAESVSPHTDLARWAELIVVAPATAASIAKVAQGLSVDLFSATMLASTAPVLVAPAMHTEMWEHPATQANVETLRGYGYRIVGPESGQLAGGDEGVGRVSEPETIFEVLVDMLAPVDGSIRMLITAGGTREPVDPVRYLGNRSSGKMGHAVANEAARRGFAVTLVTTSDIETHPAVKVVSVETAAEMAEAVAGIETEVAIMAAAVADFRPASPSDSKLARSEGLESIELVANPDILASVVAREGRPVVVGFAAETGDVERAIDKARAKDVDMLVYNDVTEPGSGFGTDTNRVVFVDREGGTEEMPMLSKTAVASELLDRVAGLVSARG